MAGFVKFDTTGNSVPGRVMRNIRDMLEELFDGFAVVATSLTLGSGTKTAAATGGAATLNKPAGVVTSEALTTAAGAEYTLTLTNSAIAAASVVLVSFANGTNTQGTLALGRVTPGAGSATIRIRNAHASEALNGTIKIAFAVIN